MLTTVQGLQYIPPSYFMSVLVLAIQCHPHTEVVAPISQNDCSLWVMLNGVTVKSTIGSVFSGIVKIHSDRFANLLVLLLCHVRCHANESQRSWLKYIQLVRPACFLSSQKNSFSPPFMVDCNVCSPVGGLEQEVRESLSSGSQLLFHHPLNVLVHIWVLNGRGYLWR